ncbi:LppA family lipoprotein [Nocardia cyriacigeorgica]|uniref:LppA family lipoprotein n=1 Tax=Nocardia cyriacigeorgica TaxID=135487 RepID=UPI0018963021|nr:LppA family lipoprotein [Nocardia cyriacigeorgica]MBF6438116.1 LppA family lipoprotein [Nocardia cyriacigeorgica]
MATRRYLPTLVSIFVLIGALSGCGSRLDDPNHPATPHDIAQAEAMMRQLPSVQETEQQLSALMWRIAEATRSVAPALDWQPKTDRAQGTLGCPSPYSETDGVSMTADSIYSPVPIADAEWPEVLRITRDLAAQHGITALTVRADEPGHHDITLHSPDDGNEISVGSRKAALITGLTGCRLRAQDIENPTSK